MSADGADAVFLGLDVGTQGTKGLLVDRSGAVLARASRAYGTIPGLGPGAAEQHPDTWSEAIAAAARELFAVVDPARLAGIGVSGQQHGMVLVGEDRGVVRAAKLWCDTETSDEARRLSAALGRRVPTGYTASKVLWTIEREPETWARARTVLLPHDWVNARLTGELTTDPGDASGTGYFDPERRCFDDAALAAIGGGLADKLPALVQPGEPAGRLTEAGAAWLGLPRSGVGAPVAAGSGDNMMAALGSGATRPGVVTLSLGTSATLFTGSAVSVADPEGLVAPFCDATGGWLPLLCVMNATGVLEEVRSAFGAGLAELTEAARAVPAGCDGLMWVPFLVGERVPDLPDAHGVLTGIRPGSLAPGRVFRAALEGVALNLAWGLQRMRAMGVEAERVRVVGGAARNELWLGILAAALDAELQEVREPEAAAFGAALQALWTERRLAGEAAEADEVVRDRVALGARVFRPDPALGALYAGALGRFRRTVETVFGSP